MLRHIDANKNKAWYFETYTAHGDARGFAASAKNLRRGWKRIQQRKRDRKGGGGDFVQIWEYHADDETLHMHVLTDVTLAKRFYLRDRVNKKTGETRLSRVGRLNDEAAKAGMGHQAEAIRLDSAIGSAFYAVKYMNKQAMGQPEYPKHHRRANYSRTWTKLDDLTTEENALTWQAVNDAQRAQRMIERDAQNTTKTLIGYAGERLDARGFVKMLYKEDEV